jgi:hypothetical protein
MIILRHTTLCRTPLDEWLASRRDLYLTTHNNHDTETSMPPAGFEPSKLAAAEPRLRLRGHWDLQLNYISPNSTTCPLWTSWPPLPAVTEV